MKLSNLAILFLVLAVMVIMVITKYISLQIETITNQADYDSKLINSTKEAIDAFEINSVQWNSDYSTVTNVRRRNINAAINSFTQSFANNLGVGGTSKEYILSYIPAVAFTLHDGFYIYTPAKEKQTIEDSNGLRVIMKEDLITQGKLNSGYTYDVVNKGKILYKCESDNEDGLYSDEPFTLDSDNALEGEYSHVLKPFISYTEELTETKYNSAPVFISYSLDNYVTVYYKNASGNYEKKSGYLTIKVSNITNGKITGIKFKGQPIICEELSEIIAFKKADNTYATDTYSYVYADDKTKVYFDGNRAFTLDSDLEKKYVDLGSSTKYKEVIIPLTSTTYKKIYQNLATGDWYEDKNGADTIAQTVLAGYGINSDKKFDYSAVNYCVGSYYFTKWFNGLGIDSSSKIETKERIIKDDGNEGYATNESNVEIVRNLYIDNNNDPESEDSIFTKHKKAVIKYVIESSLNQAITSYSKNNEGTFKLPKLTDTEWEQIYRNVSIITFAQNIPIGLKYYNNYGIATSTTNKEYVDPEEIYLYDKAEIEYHKLYCSSLTQTDATKLILMNMQ